MARPWSSSRLFCGERLLLRCDRNAGNSFPSSQGKIPPGYEAETGLLWMWAGLSCLLSSGDGLSGKFLSCSKGVRTLWNLQRLGVISLETPQQKWPSSRLEGRTSWIFSSCGRCSRLTTGTSGTCSGGLRKGQSPCELLGGLSGFLPRRCRGLRPCVMSVRELEDSSQC